MDRYSEVENAILNRLQPLAEKGLRLDNSPKQCPTAAIAAVRFYLTGESGDSIKACSQSSNVSLTFALRLCDGRDHKLAYPYLAGIKLLLNWYNPELKDYGRFEFERLAYETVLVEKGTIWLYALTFSIRSIAKEVRTNIQAELDNLFI